jgi:cation:H+ antiporter
MITDIIWILVGLSVLIAGGEFLVKGAIGIAAKAHLSTLVIGMTVVSFGTSAPELLVSLKAAYMEAPEIAIGNVIGSNIANLALVLGITVLIFPMPVSRNTLVFDWPMMMLSGLLFYLFALNFSFSRWEGLVMFSLLIAFVSFLIYNSRKNNKTALLAEELNKQELNEKEKEEEVVPFNVWKSVFFLMLGLLGLYFGAQWLIDGAKSLGESAGLSKHVIGITIVAFGTSVPELVTSVVAAYRKEMEISVGNLIGSNIFNIMAVIGITAMVHPISIESSVVNWDMLWMLGIFLAIFPMMWLKRKVNRVSGAILLSAYFLYIYLLF